jgi:hypothetical protein
MTHDVNRWHSSPHSKLRNSGDTILRHQWRVAELLTSLWPDAPRAAIDYAASHDDHEAVMGDIPSPEKQQWSAVLRRLYKAREAEVRAQMGLPHCPLQWGEPVGFCDRLDAYRWVAKHCPEALHSGGFPELREDLMRQAEGFGLGEVAL